MPRTAEQFLDSVHRRRVVAAVSDALALGVGAGAVTAGALFFAPSIAIITFATILILIVVWRLVARAGRFETAVDLDRRFDTHDLLSTAVYPSPVSDPAFARHVTAAADARFGTVDPSPFAGGRVGIRGWSLSGIALLAAAVLVFRPHAGTDHSAGIPASAVLGDLVRTAAEQTSLQQAGPSGSRAARPIDEPDASQFGQTETTAGAGTDARPPAEERHQNDPSAGTTGGGPGQSQTRAPAENKLGSTGGPAALAGTETGGGRSPGTGGTAVAGAGRGAAGAPSKSDPWQSPGWSIAQDAAAVSVNNGSVPARSRQLVHDYFDGE